MYYSTSERLSKCEAHFSENPDGGDCNEICLQCGLCEFLSENGSMHNGNRFQFFRQAYITSGSLSPSKGQTQTSSCKTWIMAREVEKSLFLPKVPPSYREVCKLRSIPMSSFSYFDTNLLIDHVRFSNPSRVMINSSC